MNGLKYSQIRKSCLFTKSELLHMCNGSSFPPRGVHFELVPAEAYNNQEMYSYEHRVRLTCVQLKDKAADLICNKCDEYKYPSVVGTDCLWCHMPIRRVRAIANHFRLCPQSRGYVDFCRGMCDLEPIC